MGTLALWVTSPEIQKLLNFLVDKLDAAKQQEKTLNRSIRLDSRSFPALYRAEFEADRELQWTRVERMASWGWVELQMDRARPGQAPYERHPRLRILDEGALRAATGRPDRVPGSGELWRKAVGLYLSGTPATKEMAVGYRIEIPGRTPEEVVLQLNQLHGLKDEGLLLREVSARLFWGQSKVLDGRKPLVAALLGQAECPFPETPIQLQVYLPPEGYTEVLLVENLATFEQAVRDSTGRYRGLALVFASGFKGSAKRLRTAGGSSVYFAATGALSSADTGRFLDWLRDAADCSLPCYFWGDLDHSGMRILVALRQVFTTMRAWAPGYAPMLARLKGGHGHSPEAANKDGQLPVSATGCPYADEWLVPALAETGKFVDQEAV